ncbi:hypothetical protein I4U23_010121 [Adineta vaga]|nr:hypothetical protein I4U23_010121 [Adineta vaga]
MIPQFQQLLPLEANLTGSWLNPYFSSETLLTTANKLLSPPISITPTSICTDLSESEYQPIDLSLTRKYSLSSPPLSNINSESIDLIDCTSLHSTMTPSNHDKQFVSTFKSTKQCSNFSIEHILSSSFRSPTYEFLSIRYRHIQSIFSKKKIRHFSDRYLHQIIHRKKKKHSTYSLQNSHRPQQIFLRYILDFYNDLIKQQKQITQVENFYTNDALGQLAEIACKLDLRQKRSLLNENNIEKKEMKGQMEKSICFHLKSDETITNLDILIPHNGLIYEAFIQRIDNYDDLLLVRLHHERQSYLIPIHDLCRLACPKMIPEDFHSLSKGLRVCAYWSTSLRGLHPAIVRKLPTEINESSMVGLVFDDGDTGLIKLNEIRLLPDDYDIRGICLDEWRVSSSQLPTSSSSSSSSRRRSCRTASNASTSTTTSLKRLKSAKTSPIILPLWTLNSRNSSLRRYDNKETILIGDCVVLHGVDKSLSYIGKVLKFYHNKSIQQDVVKIQWYYSPHETRKGVRKTDLPGALYESTHIDENPIASIKYKGTIYESYDDYVNKTDYGQRRNETDFYLVGHYNPTTGTLKRYNDK